MSTNTQTQTDDGEAQNTDAETAAAEAEAEAKWWDNDAITPGDSWKDSDRSHLENLINVPGLNADAGDPVPWVGKGELQLRGVGGIESRERRAYTLVGRGGVYGSHVEGNRTLNTVYRESKVGGPRTETIEHTDELNVLGNASYRFKARGTHDDREHRENVEWRRDESGLHGRRDLRRPYGANHRRCCDDARRHGDRGCVHRRDTRRRHATLHRADALPQHLGRRGVGLGPVGSQHHVHHRPGDAGARHLDRSQRATRPRRCHGSIAERGRSQKDSKQQRRWGAWCAP